MTRGRFITLEGGDGAGKTTQAAKLCAALEALGIKTITTREPGGSPGAEIIRELLVSGPVERWDPLTEAMLHSAARRDHVTRTIEPALENGQWVVSDRFADSTMAYQGYGQGADLSTLERLTAIALGTFEPDLTIVLDVPPDAALRRAEARSESSRYERMDGGVHARLRQGFLTIAAQAPKRCTVIDGSQDAAAVHRAIKDAVSHRLSVTFDG
jgi:dTMP kinase